MGRITQLGLISALVFAVGCQQVALTKQRRPNPMEPILPTINAVQASPTDPTLQKLKSIPMCLYAYDPATNDIMRLSLDGSKKETALKIGADYRVRASLGVGKNHYPNAKGESLVSCIPNENGVCYLDVSPTHPTGWYIQDYRDRGCITPSQYAPVETNKLTYQDTSKPSPWTVRFDAQLVELERNHYHTKLAKVTFTDTSGHTVSTKGALGLVAFVSPGIAIIHADKKLYAWDLLKDRKILIGQALKAHIWDRDLNKPGRYTPIDMSGKPTGPTTKSSDYRPNIEAQKKKDEEMRAKRNLNR